MRNSQRKQYAFMQTPEGTPNNPELWRHFMYLTTLAVAFGVPEGENWQGTEVNVNA